MFEEYKKQRIKEIQDMFHCSEEQAIGVFHELPNNDFEKWKNNQKLDFNKLSEIFNSLNLDDLFKTFPSIPIAPIIASIAIRKSIGFILKELESEGE